MEMRCPKCGRRGHLPDRWVPEAHSLRCRRCRALFKVPELVGIRIDRAPGSGYEPERSATRPAGLGDGFFDAFGDELIPPREPGPGDSSYELTITLGDLSGDSGDGWAAGSGEYEPEAPSSDEMPVASRPSTADRPEPWHHRHVERWALGLIAAAAGLIAVAIPVGAWFLLRSIAGAEATDGGAAGSIAGFACAIALLLISIPTTLLAASVTELVRDRRLDRHAAPRGAVGGR